MSTFAFSRDPFPPSCAPSRDRLNPHPDATIGNDLPNPAEATGYITHVPGDPAVSLLSDDVHVHLSNHLETPLLDEIYKKLWLIAKKSGRSIDSLHTQKVKGRSIVPTEDPRLHLVWYQDKIYIKPVPAFLLNHDFWAKYLQPPTGKSTSELWSVMQAIASAPDWVAIAMKVNNLSTSLSL